MHKNMLFLILGVSLVISGCASNGQQLHTKSPQIDRISEEELARIMPQPVAALSTEDLVRLTKEGASADQIIEKIKTSNSLYDLTPSQSVALNKQGVDIKVLDYIHTSREQALRNNVADEINKREKNRRDDLEKLRRRQWQQRSLYDPFCGYGPYGIYPFGYGSYYGSRFGLGAGFGRSWGCW